LLYTKIKKICDERGISVRKLESDLEFSCGSVCKWNDNIPSFDKVTKVADYLGVTLDELRVDNTDLKVS
jgi:hypothetical protein